VSLLTIAEVFGHAIEDQSPTAWEDRRARRCPLRDGACNKSSMADPIGICTLTAGQRATCLCPNRFLQSSQVFGDAARIAFGSPIRFVAVPEVRILRVEGGRRIGKVDYLLGKLNTDDEPSDFAALEVQATYFSGRTIRPAMEYYLRYKSLNPDDCRRRPDYRSCAQKRLMPQLQLKVPIFRRWGKRFFVAVDSLFFGALPRFKSVPAANTEITWLSYPIAKHANAFVMGRCNVHYSLWDDVLESLGEGEGPEPKEIMGELMSRMRGKPILST